MVYNYDVFYVIMVHHRGKNSLVQ